MFAHTLAAFALLAMVVRAIVPAGYMLAPAEHGRFATVTLCSSQGMQTATIDLKTGEVQTHSADQSDHGKDQSSAHSAPCVFAGIAPLAAPEMAAPVLLRVANVVALEATREAIVPGRGLAAPPPWSTGPPLAA